MNWVAVALLLMFGQGVYSGYITLKGVLITAGATATFLGVMLYNYQESLLYQPKIYPQHVRPSDNPAGMKHPGEVGLPYDNIYLTTKDNIKLHAWFVRIDSEEERRSRPTILYFHENAGNMGMRMDMLASLYYNLRANVMIISYRGYGESESVPSEDGLYLDAQAALDHLHQRTDIDKERIIVFGRSLGGGVAIDLASRHVLEDGKHDGKISGIVLENTFTSISDMVDIIFPFLKFAKPFLLRMKWLSKDKIPNLPHPILFVSGLKDELVPASHMDALYKAATKACHRDLLQVPTGTHNDTWSKAGESYWTHWKSFLQSTASNVCLSVIARGRK